MLVLSFNTWGLGSYYKIKALKRMVANLQPAIIFLQETMMEGLNAKEVLESWLKEYRFTYISLEGHLGGLITAWN